MKALVFHGPGELPLEDRLMPTLQAPNDAIVRVRTTAICGTDLHILRNSNKMIFSDGASRCCSQQFSGRRHG